MKVSSPAGDLEVFISDFVIEEDSVVFDAAVGVWQIRIHLGPGDFKFFLSVFFRLKVLLFLFKQLFRPAPKDTPE